MRVKSKFVYIFFALFWSTSLRFIWKGLTSAQRIANLKSMVIPNQIYRNSDDDFNSILKEHIDGVAQEVLDEKL